MKNLTVKKVALGLLLAGYAASGAFAATTASTAATIIGNAPTIKSTETTPTAGKYSFVVKRAGTDISTLSGDGLKPRVGDVVTVTFTYHDADGDAAESNWLTTTKANSKLEFKIAGGAAIASTDITATHPAAANGSNASYSFVIPTAAEGKGLTIDLTPISAYGNPWKGANLAGNLFDVALGDGTPPGICASVPTACIIDEFEGLTVRIKKGADVYGSSDSTEHGAIPSTIIPKIGDTFTYQVWDTLAAAGSEDVSSSYKGSWSYSGTNSAALGADNAVTTAVTTATLNSTYTVGVNATDVLTVAAGSPAYKAGAQGFNLTVTISK